MSSDKDIAEQVHEIMASVSSATKRGTVRGVYRAAAYVAGEIASEVGAGALGRSFKALPPKVVDGAVTTWAASRGAAQKYARIQDEGGVIRPRVMKALAVPIKGAGVTQGKWPRHYGRAMAGSTSGLTLMPRRGKPPLLVKVLERKKLVTKRGENRIYKTWVHAIQPMFVLMRSVTIRAKRYLSRVEGRVGNQVTELIFDSINEAEAARKVKK
jgi:hypothetical protein